jgi:hypothetical protein
MPHIHTNNLSYIHVQYSVKEWCWEVDNNVWLSDSYGCGACNWTRLLWNCAAALRMKLKFNIRKLLLSVSYNVERPSKTRNNSFSVNPHSSAPRCMSKQLVIMFHQLCLIESVAGHTHEECWNTLEKARPQRTQFITWSFERVSTHNLQMNLQSSISL